jgi:3-phenylpropionate/trans-cinnamate dioxygenase ferredoxin subunit
MYSFVDKPGITLVYHTICKVDDLPHGERIFIEIAHEPIVIFNLAGKIFAIGDVCSHDGGPVGDGEFVDNTIICPRHGAKFDIFTGKAAGLPAVEDIPAYPIRINEGQIEIGVPG